ncbi:MAG: thermonuclease family protein [Halothiobacillaceae bacterium]
MNNALQPAKPACLVVAALLLAFGGLAQADEPCPIQKEDRRLVVGHVQDGDTLRARSGEWVRLVGIDAPELGRNGKPDEPLAREAAQALRALSKQAGNRLIVQEGRESADRHGRVLAYLFAPDGTNLQRELLERGLVMQVFIGENEAFADCLTPFEAEARQARRGIWSLPEYQPGLASTEIPAGTRGAVIVHGRVVRVGHSRHSIWINLEGRVALQVDRDDASGFDDLDALEGRLVRARGWLVPDRNRFQDWRMRLSNPRALELLDD